MTFPVIRTTDMSVGDRVNTITPCTVVDCVRRTTALDGSSMRGPPGGGGPLRLPWPGGGPFQKPPLDWNCCGSKDGCCDWLWAKAPQIPAARIAKIMNLAISFFNRGLDKKSGESMFFLKCRSWSFSDIYRVILIRKCYALPLQKYVWSFFSTRNHSGSIFDRHMFRHACRSGG